MLRVTNGDTIARSIRACGIAGEVLPWRDVQGSAVRWRRNGKRSVGE